MQLYFYYVFFYLFYFVKKPIQASTTARCKRSCFCILFNLPRNVCLSLGMINAIKWINKGSNRENRTKRYKTDLKLLKEVDLLKNNKRICVNMSYRIVRKMTRFSLHSLLNSLCTPLLFSPLFSYFTQDWKYWILPP